MGKTIVVASGKGGTGKTTVAVALSVALSKSGSKVMLLDADVEAPNAHFFFGLEPESISEARSMIPEVDEDLCTSCGLCREVCEFNAIVLMGEKPLVFPELCHSCGACSIFCPVEAIHEVPKTVGWIETDSTDELSFYRGRLKIGEARSIPVIEALREKESISDWTVIDAPPGASCPVIAASRKTDYLILVTEPTPFGLNDLKLAVEMARAIGLNFGVIINRSDMGTADVASYCEGELIPILMEIPFCRNFAEAYTRGGKLLDIKPELEAQLLQIVENLQAEAIA